MTEELFQVNVKKREPLVPPMQEEIIQHPQNQRERERGNGCFVRTDNKGGRCYYTGVEKYKEGKEGSIGKGLQQYRQESPGGPELQHRVLLLRWHVFGWWQVLLQYWMVGGCRVEQRHLQLGAKHTERDDKVCV